MLIVIAIAQLMVVLDLTIVNIALPSAQADLGFPDSGRQWVVTAYALAFGSLLLLGGKIGDLFGRKRAFIAGLVGFAAASVLGGVAQNFAMLTTSRALQGVFGAMLAPSALAILATAFATEPKERGKAFGIFGAVSGGGGAIGLLLGGVLTEYASWRWCFFVNLLFAAAAILGALTLLRHTPTNARPKIDLAGTVLAAAGLFSVVFGFSHAETAGWSDPLTITVLATAAALLIAFVTVQAKIANPLLPLRVVHDRNRGTAYLSVGLLAIASFSIFLFLTFYLQQVKHYSSILTGVAFLPMIACILLAATIVSTILLHRLGARPLIVTGMLLGAAGMFWLSRLTTTSGYAPHILPALIAVGLGYGLVLAPGLATATHGVQYTDAGVASALVNTMQQIGGAIGTALLSTIAASAAATHLSTHPTAALASTVHGYTTAFLVAGCVFIAGAITAAALFTRPTRQTATDVETLAATGA